ncbi:MAG: DNA mismatch repair endonuclease MutL [Brumimicrobium sp.]|nr:DNA mismatch repair endonuclease MutL [Brumimicrobium sp.]
MPEIIHLLPDNIANQIAAGEVIQRPASVVKELVENAVDAGAQKIELHVKDAGKTLIQVIDDGKGMSEMDARMSFERHATSKITSAKDLFQLTTKGFRGEALASIAAIAHVEMDTVEKDAKIGTKIQIEGSKLKSQEPSTRLRGTSISVKNLFFNVPARRNFLKSDNIETKHITEEFERIALTHPEVAFVFSHNNNIIYNLESANLRKRIVDLYGKGFNTKLVPIEEETDLVKIYGFIVKPEFSRKTRGEQFLFVNHRFFKDNYLHHAISSAYENLISNKEYPSYFIFFEVTPDTIDVNIHPTKTEIKFQHEKSIYPILRSTVRSALGKYNISPSLDFEHEPQFDLSQEVLKQPVRQPEIKVNTNYNPFKDTSTSSQEKPLSPSLKPNKQEWEDFYKITEEAKVEQPTEIEFEEKQDNNSLKIQVHKKFLLTQVKSGLLLVHIPRANERILYETLMEQYMRHPISSQQLLFPYEYQLQATQKLEWENNKTIIQRLGFEWEWNGNMLVLGSIPSILEVENTAQCIDNILNKITFTEIDKGEIVHELIVSLAAATSKNSNKILSQEEMSYLIETLFQYEQHQYSPSGKRIINTITLDELNNFLSL